MDNNNPGATNTLSTDRPGTQNAKHFPGQPVFAIGNSEFPVELV